MSDKVGIISNGGPLNVLDEGAPQSAAKKEANARDNSESEAETATEREGEEKKKTQPCDIAGILRKTFLATRADTCQGKRGTGKATRWDSTKTSHATTGTNHPLMEVLVMCRKESKQEQWVKSHVL